MRHTAAPHIYSIAKPLASSCQVARTNNAFKATYMEVQWLIINIPMCLCIYIRICVRVCVYVYGSLSVYIIIFFSLFISIQSHIMYTIYDQMHLWNVNKLGLKLFFLAKFSKILFKKTKEIYLQQQKNLLFYA